MGWTGIRNGELLKLAVGSFDAFLTDALPIAVVVLVAPTNRIESLRPLVPVLLRTLDTLAPRQLVRVGVSSLS